MCKYGLDDFLRLLIGAGLAVSMETAAQDAVGQDRHWTPVFESGRAERYHHAMAFDSARGVVVLFGGLKKHGPRGGTTRSGETWEWDGVDWELVAETGPSPRTEPVMAYDSVRGVVVLFGGEDPYTRNDTWEWDGRQWRQVAETGPFGVGSHAAMVYDVDRRVTILFDGQNRVTWAWDGVEWRHISVGGPTQRSYHAIAYDSDRRVIVLFGGWVRFINRGEYLGDTWEWDGVDWKQVAGTGPSRPTRRREATMAYDRGRRRTVLFGGDGGQAGLHDDTWEWDGVEWARGAVNPPPRRRGHAMAYDSNRDALVLAGGADYDGPFGDTWELRRLELGVEATCPDGGSMRIEWSGATPRGRIALLFGRNANGTVIPQGNPCAGVSLGIRGGVRILLEGTTGTGGGAVIITEHGPAACGGHLQLLDLTTCATSNVARIE